MAGRFNLNNPSVVLQPNLAGGQSHAQTPELELVSILLTSFASDTFYEKAASTFDRLKQVAAKVDPKFAAKAAIYARNVFGMRSITHVLAASIAPQISGFPWAKNFYEQVVFRVDDMAEIMAYYASQNVSGKLRKNKKAKTVFPAAMLKGFKAAFNKFNGYQLAKYRSEDKSFKLIDVVNVVHPIPTEKNGKALQDLVSGALKNTGTWESNLSAVGSEGGAATKAEAWADLVIGRKLGYLALLRNLRNIIQNAPTVAGEAIKQLTDEAAIAKSKIMPFQFETAFQEIEQFNDVKLVREVLAGINKALDISVSNVPKFDGETLIVLDTSQSMTQGEGKPAKTGRLFAAILVKANNADFMTFDNYARYQSLNPLDSTITISKSIRFMGGGTNFINIFEVANKKYDRIVILSDMQAWIGSHTPRVAYNCYRTRTGAEPLIYSFDLAGHGSMQFPERNVYALAGFSDKVFDVMKALEIDPKALVNTIKALPL